MDGDAHAGGGCTGTRTRAASGRRVGGDVHAGALPCTHTVADKTPTEPRRGAGASNLSGKATLSPELCVQRGDLPGEHERNSPADERRHRSELFGQN